MGNFKLLLVLAGLAGFSLLGLSMPSPAGAQMIGIKVSPVKIEEVVDPGESITRTLSVTNRSGDNNTFYIYLRDFRAEGETGSARLVAPGAGDETSLASWIDITDEGIPFGPNEEKAITFTVNVPENAGPGGYFSAILLGTQPPKLQINTEGRGAGMSIAQQTASLILLRVRGDVYEEARIREFTTDNDTYSTPFEVKFLLRLNNLGNVHIKPYGTISIENMFGKEVGQLRVNEKGGNILPESIRRFEETWSGKTGFGKYTARLGLTYGLSTDLGGQGKSSLFSVTEFWIIPWRIIVPVMLGLLFFASLFILMLKLYRNKAVRRAMEQAGLGQMKYVRQFQGPSPALHLGLILLIVFILSFLLVLAVYFLFFA